MVVNMSRKIFNLINEKYTSIEYVLEETIPAISLTNLVEISTESKKGDLDVVEVELSENLINQLELFTNDKITITDMVNELIAIGYILEV